MYIQVKVKPKSREEKVVQLDSTHYVVYVKEAPDKGKANKAVIESLSAHFHVPKSLIKITSGLTSKQKHVEILSPLRQ